MNLVSQVLDQGGKINPLILPILFYPGTGLFNPSVLNYNGNLLLNIRHCQYSIYHAEKLKYEHQFGPLVYMHPESDLTLTTKNYLCFLDDNYEIKSYNIIDTSLLDTKPLWTFVGLEDVRLVNWENKLYAIGVRRDTTTNGEGRMELSEIIFENNVPKEINRFRIPAPGKNDAYCEKNWMPIIDKPYHFVKWCNPTEVVKVDIENKICTTVYLGNYTQRPLDFRGGSQVIKFGENRLSCIHTSKLFNSEAGRKNATYRHHFVIWDKDWNIVKVSKPFSFMNAEIEFCAGITEYKNNILITFGFQDNSAYLLETTSSAIKELLWE